MLSKQRLQKMLAHVPSWLSSVFLLTFAVMAELLV
jgi:hypothetical protein